MRARRYRQFAAAQTVEHQFDGIQAAFVGGRRCERLKLRTSHFVPAQAALSAQVS
jgi:hypothetical protein